jgi:hypothetical protein
LNAWIDVILQDLRYWRRMVRRNLTFSVTTVVTLALGIAAVTVIFSVVDAVLLRPLEFRDPDQIYRLRTIDEQGLPRGTVGRVLIDPVADDSESVEAAVYAYSLESSVVNREGTAFAINEYRVSEEFFQVFTDPLTLGRAFQPGDDFDKTVLSYQTWRDVFGSDPDIVGAPIRVNGAQLNVIGVAAKASSIRSVPHCGRRFIRAPAPRVFSTWTATCGRGRASAANRSRRNSMSWPAGWS